MKLPADAVIARRKLTHYLLVHQLEDDKSAWLFSAGYTMANPELVEREIREQVLSQRVTEIQTSRFGKIFIVDANLRGPSGVILRVRSVWLRDSLSDKARFVTLYPNKTRQ